VLNTDKIQAPTTIDLTPAACPDGIAFCEGDPEDHATPDEHHHSGPITSMTGSYLTPFSGPIMELHILQWHGHAPEVTFVGDGDWPQLNLGQVDELIGDTVQYLIKLRSVRRQFAILTKDREYGRTTTTEDMAEDLPAAAFSVVLDALDAALKASPDRARTLSALRCALDLTEDDAYGA
jgi:hypothetical protein